MIERLFRWIFADRRRWMAVAGVVTLVLGAGFYINHKPTNASEVCNELNNYQHQVEQLNGVYDNPAFNAAKKLGSEAKRLKGAGDVDAVHRAGQELQHLGSSNEATLGQFMSAVGPISDYCSNRASALSTTSKSFGAPPDGSVSTVNPQPSASVDAGAGSSSNGPCTYTTAGTASKTVTGLPASTGPASTQAVVVNVATTVGDISLSLDAAQAPCTVNSFMFLADQHYFDGTTCHRLTTSGIFVLQCGDPSGSGTGGPGYKFADENLTGATYPKGTVAMANNGAGTNGSQFFLVYKDSQLPPNYTPFGTITSGQDVLDTVANAGATPAGDGKPNKAVTIRTATLS
jgi:peptidyl-prolyl cis-trans isomerase B (cyclophilin B)